MKIMNQMSQSAGRSLIVDDRVDDDDDDNLMIDQRPRDNLGHRVIYSASRA